MDNFITRWVWIDDRTEEEVKIPTVWAICWQCQGDGMLPYGGGVSYTGSEWAEACDGDPDFAEDYRSGNYDRPCSECRSTGKVREENWESLPERIQTALEEAARIDAEIDAQSAAERRMGC